MSCSAAPLNCTAQNAGSVIRPNVKDPCFSCECQVRYWHPQATNCVGDAYVVHLLSPCGYDFNFHVSVIYTEQKKKVSTFVITTIFQFEPKCSIELEYIIHHYCQLWIKLTFPKLLKRDSAGDRLSKNRKSSCKGNIDYKNFLFK